jgi:dolichyl-phosphate-mannose-protein mannosyltransferase
MSIQLAEQPAARATGSAPTTRSAVAGLGLPALLVVALLTVAGVAIRLIVGDQSLWADELSTYWISATHGFGGVVSLMYGTPRIPHAEITPPLYFLASWATYHLGHSVEWLRAPSLIAGALTIPLVYLLGLRTISRRGALLTVAFTALSPFMIYYSAEARAYAVMMALVIASTLSMLLAVQSGRVRWWVAYGACSCAAFYTHYTSAFVLAAALVWLFWAHPEARRPAVLANLAAAAALIPWLPGLINDFRSPTLNILSVLSPFTPAHVADDLGHWAVGYPYATAGSLARLPGIAALILLGTAMVLGAAGLVLRLRRRAARTAIDRHVALVVGCALAVPVGEALISAAGNHIFGVRNLAASWPFLALSFAAMLSAAGRRISLIASALAVIGIGVGGFKMLTPRFHRPDYQGAAAFVNRTAGAGDVVIDETGLLSPGPLTDLDVSVRHGLAVVRADSPAERGHPFSIGDRVVAPAQAIRSATRLAASHRVFLVTNVFPSDAGELSRYGYRMVQHRLFAGMGGTEVSIYTSRPLPR